jgi:hypothetical protein
MAKSQQTHAKRARELALQERRERKKAKRAEAAAQRAGGTSALANGSVAQEPKGQAETDAAEWVQ